jgi:hypothetical protein
MVKIMFVMGPYDGKYWGPSYAPPTKSLAHPFAKQLHLLAITIVVVVHRVSL